MHGLDYNGLKKPPQAELAPARYSPSRPAFVELQIAYPCNAFECILLLQEDPFSGTVHVYRKRRSTSLKALVQDGQGFWVGLERSYTNG